MAVSANDGPVRLRMNEEVSDLVQQLDARDPYAVNELVLRSCVLCEPTELCEQIGRCARLRRLNCVGCAFKPSILLKLMLGGLQYLQQLELSLVQDPELVADSEIDSMRLIALQMRHVIQYHSLRRFYVEVGGDRNFQLLRELLVFWPNLTELHVHIVHGMFSNALAQCHLLHEQLNRLEMFTFTSELPASIPFPYGPGPTLTFMNCAVVCANVHHDRPNEWWSCVELNHLALNLDQALILPFQLTAFVVEELTAGTSLHEKNRRGSWARVRELCLLLLPSEPSFVSYPRAGGACRDHLENFFCALESIVELNVSSFHFPLNVNARRLLLDTPLGRRLLALSAPPCWFPKQSCVRMLTFACPNLTDLDVRVESRGGHLQCDSCSNLLYRAERMQEPSDASEFLSTTIARLTLCDVPYRVLPWYFECFGAAVTLRLAEWRFLGSPQYGHFCRRLGECVAIRCLLLQHENLPIEDQHLQAGLCRMTNLQHLCLLTSVQVSDADAEKCVDYFATRSAQLKCLHIHYRHKTDNWEQRVTWLRRRPYQIRVRDCACFACCSTATFIGLVKPVSRECELDVTRELNQGMHV
ncbi:hypothetical protein HPB52_009859 [Rhipicephalus sanguineus]|uniref:Uncharacterized protein n=1 Tax=Rhipicephalus sanguineus TaxID=34632 RepID=A0A9D4PIY0_RHISA|nr:hypothetical protein HPB52_009859 [Rhipicephalus sanguineus]